MRKSGFLVVFSRHCAGDGCGRRSHSGLYKSLATAQPLLDFRAIRRCAVRAEDRSSDLYDCLWTCRFRGCIGRNVVWQPVVDKSQERSSRRSLDQVCCERPSEESRPWPSVPLERRYKHMIFARAARLIAEPRPRRRFCRHY